MVDASGFHYLPTASSEDCIGVFHSSEMDDLTQYDEGFYVGAFISPVIGCVVGPYRPSRARLRQ